MKEHEIVKGWILFKTGFPANLFKEPVYVYKTKEEAEAAKDEYVHGVAKYLTVFPIKIIFDL